MNPLDLWLPRIVLAACLVLPCLECDARAEPARVDAAQVCAVKRALRTGPAWSAKTCATVAEALNQTTDPRLFAAIAVLESGLRERAINAVTEKTMDVGMLQVRCVMDDRQRCTNGAAKGLEARRLLEPGTNVRTAEAVLKSHQGLLYRYNGSRKPNGYTARVMTLVAAWGGELRIPRGATGPKWARVRALARRIVEATKGERRS